MIEKKVLNKTKIKKILKDYYNIKVNDIQLVSGGSAEIYKVDNYILKLYQKKYNEEQISKEVNVINYLKNGEFKVPNYLKTIDDKYLVKVDDRYLIVQEFINGITKDKFMATKKEIKECGYLHGLLVKNLMDYKVDDKEDGNWYDFNSNIEKLNEIIKFGNNKLIVSDLSKKIEMMNSFEDDLKDIDKISYYTSHGDFSYLQFIYDKGKVNAIIDFIRVKRLPIVWEIIRSYSYMDKKCKDAKIDIDNLILYVKEFMKNVKLTKYDLKYMPYVYMCQLFRSTYGYKEYYKKDNNNILKFAHFRTQLCEYLFNNSKEISRRLEEL